MYIGRANVRKVAEKRREALDKYLEVGDIFVDCFKMISPFVDVV